MHRPASSQAPPAGESEPTSAASEDVYVFPASYSQQGLWLVDQFNPGGTVDSLPVLLRLEGPLDSAVLERALNEIVRRHEMLRTTFSLQHGALTQVIVPAAEVHLVRLDLTFLDVEQRSGRAFQLAGEEIHRPFDLERGPLFRANLWRLGDLDHVLLLSLNRLVADLRSFAILFQELDVLYRAYARGNASPLPELALQYADFAKWQQERFQGEALEEHLAYWKAALAGADAFLELPTDRPRPPRQSTRGASESFVLSPSLTAEVRALSRREGATPFMTLLAAVFTLLSRHTGQTDIVVGSPIAYRTRGELEPLIGLLMNTLVLRANLAGDPAFRDLLARVRQTCVDAYAHQDLPFEKLLETLTLSHTPVFQVLVTFQNAPAGPPRLEGLTVTPIPLEVETSKFDLAVYFEEGAEEISVLFHYNVDLFDASTVRWMLGHFRTLLEQIAAHPERPLSRLLVLTPAEGTAGKVDRAALPAPVQEPAPAEKVYAAPRSVLETRVARIWEELLGVHPVGIHDKFFDLGGHSLLALHLLTRVARETGRTLPLAAIFQAQTVAEMAARLEEERTPEAWSSLIAIQPGGSRPPFFCVHAQGGQALEYRAFLAFLGNDQPLYGLAPQGLDGRLPPHDRVEDMAAHYVKEIRGLVPEGPYYLGGWSFGGAIAFEMARQLQAADQSVAFLAMFDTDRRPWELRRRSSRGLAASFRFLGQRLGFHLAAVRRLEPGFRLRYIVTRALSACRWIRRHAEKSVDSILARLRPRSEKTIDLVYAANLRAAERYVPGAYRGEITLFRATGLGFESVDDPYLGWGEVAGIDIEVVEVAGAHRSILREEGDTRALAEKLRDRLRMAQQTETQRRAKSAGDHV